MTTSNAKLGAMPRPMLFEQGVQGGTQQPKMLASLMAEAEKYPMPTEEEMAEADRIIAEAFAPYIRDFC